MYKALKTIMHEKDNDPYKQGDTHLDKLIKKEYLKKILAVRRTDNWNDLLILRQAKIIKEKASVCGASAQKLI